jgi:uncharacterized protein
MSDLIYIHGFLSSPLSYKARQTAEWLAENYPDITFHCPHLSPYPRATQDYLANLVELLLPRRVGLIGSSLGGFWSTWLVEKYDLRAMLVNPAVRPWEFMPDYLEVDLKSYHTDDSYRLNAGHIDEIKACDVEIQRRGNYWLLAQTGDETLDYSQAVEKYLGCKQTVEEGGDHGFQGFERFLSDGMTFLFP